VGGGLPRGCRAAGGCSARAARRPGPARPRGGPGRGRPVRRRGCGRRPPAPGPARSRGWRTPGQAVTVGVAGPEPALGPGCSCSSGPGCWCVGVAPRPSPTRWPRKTAAAVCFTPPRMPVAMPPRRDAKHGACLLGYPGAARATPGPAVGATTVGTRQIRGFWPLHLLNGLTPTRVLTDCGTRVGTCEAACSGSLSAMTAGRGRSRPRLRVARPEGPCGRDRRLDLTAEPAREGHDAARRIAVEAWTARAPTRVARRATGAMSWFCVVTGPARLRPCS
jgi:hypothetical protein